MTTKYQILRDIRLNCMDCCNNSDKEVETCNVGINLTSTVGQCKLYPYRFGKDPNPAKGGRNPFAARTTKDNKTHRSSDTNKE